MLPVRGDLLRPTNSWPAMAGNGGRLPSSKSGPHKRILVIDVGGTNVKLLLSGEKNPVKIPSGSRMTAKAMVEAVLVEAATWKYSAVSIGYPGPVLDGKPAADPHNLAPGWVDFDFSRALACPVKIVNDAAMQALGSYQGGRMLFLGLGTGLGSALLVDNVLVPTELAHLPYMKARTFEDYVGIRGLKRLGKKRWRGHVLRVIEVLKKALGAEYVVLGGGNARLLESLPEGVMLGDNSNAFRGGFKLWQPQNHSKRKAA